MRSKREHFFAEQQIILKPSFKSIKLHTVHMDDAMISADNRRLFPQVSVRFLY